MKSTARVAILLFVAVVWLNQGALAQTFAERSGGDQSQQSWLAAGRSPFAKLYLVGGDERLFFAVSGAILGAPFDAGTLARGRGEVPAAFQAVTPVQGARNIPYRDVPLEYPPANLPFIVLPRLLVSSLGAYASLFGALMGALLVAAVLFGVRLRRTFGEGALGERHGLSVACALVLAHGAVATLRLDAIPALVLVLLVDSVVRRRHRAIGLWAGLLFATKLVPVLVLPVLLAIDYEHTQRSAREWARLVGGFALSTTLGLGFVVLVPGAVEQILRYHANRGLHVESTLGIALGAVEAMRGRHAITYHDFGSSNFHGPASSLLASCALPLTIVATTLLVVVIRRSGPPRGLPEDKNQRWRARRLIASAYALVVVLWLTSKVFSPQYLTWGLPLAVALWGRGRVHVIALTGAAMLVSQVYFRLFYGEVLRQTALGLVLLVTRQALLIALLAVLVRMACARPGTLFHSRRDPEIAVG